MKILLLNVEPSAWTFIHNPNELVVFCKFKVPLLFINKLLLAVNCIPVFFVEIKRDAVLLSNTQSLIVLKPFPPLLYSIIQDF